MKRIDLIFIALMMTTLLSLNLRAEPRNGAWGQWQYVSHYARSEDCTLYNDSCGAYVCTGYDVYVRFCEYALGSDDCEQGTNEEDEQEGGPAACDYHFSGCYCNPNG